MRNLLQVLESMPKLYSTDGQKVKDVKLTFMVLGTEWTWYVVEAEKQSDDDWLFFCYCHSGLGDECSEWGYVTLSQLAEVHAFAIPNHGLKIDLDGRLSSTTFCKMTE